MSIVISATTYPIKGTVDKKREILETKILRSKLHLPVALKLEVIRSAFTERKMVNKNFDSTRKNGNKEGGDFNGFIDTH